MSEWVRLKVHVCVCVCVCVCMCMCVVMNIWHDKVQIKGQVPLVALCQVSTS